MLRESIMYGGPGHLMICRLLSQNTRVVRCEFGFDITAKTGGGESCVLCSIFFQTRNYSNERPISRTIRRSGTTNGAKIELAPDI